MRKQICEFLLAQVTTSRLLGLYNLFSTLFLNYNYNTTFYKFRQYKFLIIKIGYPEIGPIEEKNSSQ